MTGALITWSFGDDVEVVIHVEPALLPGYDDDEPDEFWEAAEQAAWAKLTAAIGAEETDQELSERITLQVGRLYPPRRSSDPAIDAYNAGDFDGVRRVLDGERAAREQPQQPQRPEPPARPSERDDYARCACGRPRPCAC